VVSLPAIDAAGEVSDPVAPLIVVTATTTGPAHQSAIITASSAPSSVSASSVSAGTFSTPAASHTAKRKPQSSAAAVDWMAMVTNGDMEGLRAALVVVENELLLAVYVQLAALRNFDFPPLVKPLLPDPGKYVLMARQWAVGSFLALPPLSSLPSAAVHSLKPSPGMVAAVANYDLPAALRTSVPTLGLYL
jgi:hypothetical protein